MWINYSDSEVNRFHPICENALNLAITALRLQNTYQVIHHQHTGSLEMDYVIQNKRTGKYLCVVEVKRTPSDVHSARYQYQAMSYVQMNEGQTEAPFYILTNLEYAFAFRYDAHRPRVFQQMLAPGLHCIGLFADFKDEIAFTERLSVYFESRIREILSGQYAYLVTLDQFATHMEQIKADPKKWKSHLAVMLYEYIRGAFTVAARSDLHDVRLFSNNVLRICNEAARINFHEIFGHSPDKYERTAIIDNNILVNLFDFGYQNVTGDSVADVLHQIVSTGHEHEGEVPTDLELGRALSVLTHSISGDLVGMEKLCDPAAGSGSLISSAIPVYNLSANQIIANDINHQLGELLSLRLGLNFTKTVGRTNSPVVSCKDVCDLPKEYFDEVKVVVMNPPFLGGVYAAARKQAFYRRINQLAGYDTGSNIGQMPLEAAFLELMTYLVRPGTTIACVFPKTHLTARGIEAQKIRNLLVSRFGLKMIFNYPGKEIFTDVTKDTCVLIGQIGTCPDSISIISSYDTIPNIDLDRLARAIVMPIGDVFQPIMPGVVAKSTKRNDLLSSIGDGWRGINSEMLEAINFVNDTFQENDQFLLVSETGWKMKRGGAGNSGGSDLLFFDSRPELFRHFPGIHDKLRPGMRNAELDTFVANSGDSCFLDSSALDAELVSEIIRFYSSLPARNGSQARFSKSVDQWQKILQKESRGRFLPNAVLIPRALRRKGRVHLVENDIFVSTNFLVCYGMDKKNAVLLSTWISTIFYQLICEVSSKDQEGLRKMEIGDIAQTYVPSTKIVDERTYHKLCDIAPTIEFLDLQAPVIREVDRIWAKYLFGDKAAEKLEEAQKLLGYLASRRNA